MKSTFLINLGGAHLKEEDRKSLIDKILEKITEPSSISLFILNDDIVSFDEHKDILVHKLEQHVLDHSESMIVTPHDRHTLTSHIAHVKEKSKKADILIVLCSSTTAQYYQYCEGVETKEIKKMGWGGVLQLDYKEDKEPPIVTTLKSST